MTIDLGNEVLAFIGVQGIGKSTLAQQLAAQWHVLVLSTDSIREEMFAGRPYSPRYNPAVWNLFYHRLDDAILIGKPFIIDVTNAFAADRRTLMNHIPWSVTITGVWMRAPLAVALDRNASRTDKAPLPVGPIVKAYAALENYPPSYNEGFSRLLVLNAVTQEITAL